MRKTKASSVREKVCVNEGCKSGGKLIPVQRFRKGRHVCRACCSKQSIQTNDRRINRIVEERLLASEIIQQDEIQFANLLYRSCERAIKSRKYSKNYVNVTCDWTDVVAMMTDLICEKEQFWNEWSKQSTTYLGSDKQLSTRPTLDRIDERGHYTLSNIQMLSYGENSKKA
ncbi:hypothetical protein [Cohnella endophytica]|nr:hypothetical protein [Cohnella endophytica]